MKRHVFGTRILGVLVWVGIVLAHPARAMGGTVTFAYPEGAVECTYKIYDEDPIRDDLLESGEKSVPPTAAASDMVPIGLDKLFCKDGEVHGPAGSSGETKAEIVVEVTWTFENGNTSVVTIKRIISCHKKEDVLKGKK